MGTAESILTVSNDNAFLGHPKGLLYLAFTEAWERFSSNGMTALLVPGDVENIAGDGSFRSTIESVVGPLSTQALASRIFGLYSGFVYFTPLLGGIIADRWIGQRNAVVMGALFMSAGHLAMAFEQSFLMARLRAPGFSKEIMAKRRGAHHPGGASLLYAPGEANGIRADWTFPRHPTPLRRIPQAVANRTCRHLEK